MSYLQNQINAFGSSVKSSSAKVANKRSIGPTSSGTATPSSVQIKPENSDLKRKRPEQNETSAYSQPADTGTGKNIMTQITYAVEYLKSKGVPQTLNDLLSYLSLQHKESQYKNSIAAILQRHDKVDFERKRDGAESTYSFRPVHNIRSSDRLLGHLQSQHTFQGLSARELRDGWPQAEDAIDELEEQGKLLVTRNRKDNHAKMVWPDDPSLKFQIDDEFQSIWHKIRLPPPDALADELKREGLTPANKKGSKKATMKTPEKKRKKPRKGGRTTNTHMAGVLRDYSHLKK